MITISKPHIENNRVVSLIKVDNKVKECWFETDDTHSKYLTDVVDPFVVSLLPGALKYNHQIVCEGQMTDELYFNIVNMYIPTVTKYDKSLKQIKINVELVPEKGRKTAKIGTGITMGVDSLYVLKKYVNTGTQFDVDYCALFDIGIGTYIAITTIQRMY